ncbi:unnamed protein product [Durusdinium trenchii]|uniref:Secreted protein n=1 Tax=Durusdinium trenchii TaxID=1381693 RepID=A0ABP0J025_9DINO
MMFVIATAAGRAPVLPWASSAACGPAQLLLGTPWSALEPPGVYRRNLIRLETSSTYRRRIVICMFTYLCYLLPTSEQLMILQPERLRHALRHAREDVVFWAKSL